MCQPIKKYLTASLPNAHPLHTYGSVRKRVKCSFIYTYIHIGSESTIKIKMQFMLLFSRQGKLRLQKWYVPLSDKERKKISRDLVQTILARKPKMCSFLEWRDLKIVYKRYASLYFCCAVEDQDNELITLEIIHRYVELLDKYFGSVCELDIIFNFEKAYFILDEFLLGGEAQETSKKNVLKAIEQADLLQEDAKEAEAPRSVLEEIGLT
uniref:AP-1 complex subunit sigma-2 n=3 Tax=Protacanthopterygii TaxID=41705 RepID=A0AAY5LAP4_ESOLU